MDLGPREQTSLEPRQISPQDEPEYVVVELDGICEDVLEIARGNEHDEDE